MSGATGARITGVPVTPMYGPTMLLGLLTLSLHGYLFVQFPPAAQPTAASFVFTAWARLTGPQRGVDELEAALNVQHVLFRRNDDQTAGIVAAPYGLWVSNRKRLGVNVPGYGPLPKQSEVVLVHSVRSGGPQNGLVLLPPSAVVVIVPSRYVCALSGRVTV